MQAAIIKFFKKDVMLNHIFLLLNKWFHTFMGLKRGGFQSIFDSSKATVMKEIFYPWFFILLISTLVMFACSFQGKKNSMIFQADSQENAYVLPVQLNNHFWN